MPQPLSLSDASASKYSSSLQLNNFRSWHQPTLRRRPTPCDAMRCGLHGCVRACACASVRAVFPGMCRRVVNCLLKHERRVMDELDRSELVGVPHVPMVRLEVRRVEEAAAGLDAVSQLHRPTAAAAARDQQACIHTHTHTHTHTCGACSVRPHLQRCAMHPRHNILDPMYTIYLLHIVYIHSRLQRCATDPRPQHVREPLRGALLRPSARGRAHAADADADAVGRAPGQLVRAAERVEPLVALRGGLCAQQVAVDAALDFECTCPQRVATRGSTYTGQHVATGRDVLRGAVDAGF